MLKITVFYEDIKEDHFLTSDTRLSTLRKIIDETHVPYNSQILKLVKGKNESIDIDLSQDEKMFNTMTPLWNIVFELINRCSF